MRICNENNVLSALNNVTKKKITQQQPVLTQQHKSKFVAICFFQRHFDMITTMFGGLQWHLSLASIQAGKVTRNTIRIVHSEHVT